MEWFHQPLVERIRNFLANSPANRITTTQQPRLIWQLFAVVSNGTASVATMPIVEPVE
jgi:hypothetical protein